MSKQQIVDVFGETTIEDLCCNYTCKHGLSEHIGKSYRCKCKNFKTSGGCKK